MKLEDCRITFLINAEYTQLELHDSTSNSLFVRLRLTPKQLSMVLSRLARVECECDVYDLEKLGKRHENKPFVFEIGEENIKGSAKELTALCLESLKSHDMNEWVPDEYYDRQDSFFKKDGKEYARVTIRRWV